MKKFNLYLFVVYLFSFGIALASTTNGTIDTTYKYSKVCDSGDCTASSTINFLPTGSTPITIVDISSTQSQVSGYAWGATLGWINMNPTGSGVVANISTGALSGSAWSPVSGYINFAPTNYGVTINANGEFNGYAWAGGPSGGWIKFDCTTGSLATCVKTDWRPTAGRTVVPSGGGGGGGGGGSIVTPGTYTTPTTNTNTGSATTQTGPQNQKNGDYTNPYRADINDSGIVDIFDYNSIMVNWNKTKTLDKTTNKATRCLAANVADVNCDGTIDLLDFNIIMIFWGQKIGLSGT